MKNSLKFILLSFCFCFCTQPIQAKGIIIFSYDDEKCTKIADLPENEQFRLADGGYMDVGCYTKQVTLFWILPIWNYDKEYCGYAGSDKVVKIVDQEAFKSEIRAAGITLPDEPDLGLWDRFGGKLVVILLLLLIYMPRSDTY